jgi:Protein of unknown function VcgC/VcgE (DUF2780)
MPDIVDQLAAQTGISSELIHKGLGALFSFLKKELGQETYSEVESSVPEASTAVAKFESAPEAAQAPANLLGVVADLAGKFLGGKTGAGADLLSNLSKLGFKPEQIESFLPRALELIKTYVSPELIQKILASLPALTAMLSAGKKQEANPV